MKRLILLSSLICCLGFSANAALPWTVLAEGNNYWAEMFGVKSYQPKKHTSAEIITAKDLKADPSLRLINAALQYQINQLTNNDLCRFSDSLRYALVFLSGGTPIAGDNFDRAGWWKLSYPIAQRYGLKINADVDERFDYEKSTQAAMNYAKDLQKTFKGKSWLVAFVDGPLAVNRPASKYATDSSLASLHALDKLMKASFYSKGEEYAVQYFYANVKTWKTNERVHTDLIFEKTGIQENVFYALNPDLRGKIIPAKTTFKLTNLALENYKNNEEDILMLSDVRIEEGEQKLAVAQERVQSNKPSSTANSTVYKVRRGDNLGFIAERYGVGVSQLKSWNNLRSDVIFVGQKLVLYSKPDAIPVTTASIKKEESTEKSFDIKPGDYIVYKVKSGDTLWSIAKKYPGISPDNLMEWNKVSTDIQENQKLKILKSEIRNYSASAYPDSQ